MAEDAKTKRFILGVGKHRIAFDFTSRVTRLPDATGDQPARVLPMKYKSGKARNSEHSRHQVRSASYLLDRIEYTRSPSRLNDLTFSPIFFVSCPLMKPRTLCACQPVASISALSVAPPDLRRSAITISDLVAGPASPAAPRLVY